MTKENDRGSSYRVGRGKPPKQTQFAAGRSGNPKGRPKGSKNFATVIQGELKRPVVVTEDGRRRRITKREAVAKQLVNRAAAGDPKSIPVLLNETRRYESEVSDDIQLEALGHEDQMVAENIVRRIREVMSAPPPADATPLESPPEVTPADESAGSNDDDQWECQ
jgi:uncharacterized protein DUF5681